MTDDLAAWTAANARARAAYRRDTACPDCDTAKPNHRPRCDDCTAARKREQNRETKRKKKR